MKSTPALPLGGAPQHREPSLAAAGALPLSEGFKIHGQGQLLSQGRPLPLVPRQDVADHQPKADQQQAQDVGQDPFRHERAVGGLDTEEEQLLDAQQARGDGETEEEDAEEDVLWFVSAAEREGCSRKQEEAEAHEPLDEVEAEGCYSTPAVQAVHVCKAFLPVVIEHGYHTHKGDDQREGVEEPVEDFGRALGLVPEDPVNQESIPLEEDHANDHAERVDVELQRAFPSNTAPVLAHPGSGHGNHSQT